MPELPEVETVRLQLEEKIKNEQLVSVSKSRLSLRKPFSCSTQKINRSKISQLSRWGKRLFIHLDKEGVFDISLGMTGSFRVEGRKKEKIKHDHIILNFKSGKRLVYNDPRRFGWFEFKAKAPQLVGWDPLLSRRKDFSFVVENASKTEVDVYTFLMNQKYIVGLGNIYVQEILFKSKVSPFRRVKDCTASDFEQIRKHTLSTLKKSLKSGGSTILNYTNAEGGAGAFQTKLKVYGKKLKEPCVVCKTPITHVQTVRAICFCSHCQT